MRCVFALRGNGMARLEESPTEARTQSGERESFCLQLLYGEGNRSTVGQRSCCSGDSDDVSAGSGSRLRPAATTTSSSSSATTSYQPSAASDQTAQQ